MESNVSSFNALAEVVRTLLECCCGEHTIKTDSKSSRTRASWISSGIRSKGSCFAFPLDFGVVLEAPTRELRGARTKEVSAIKDGSSRATRALVPIPPFSSYRVPLSLLPREGIPSFKSSSMPSCGSLLRRTEAIVPVIWTKG